MLLALVFPVCVAGVLLPMRILLENPMDFPDGLPLLVNAGALVAACFIGAGVIVPACGAGRRRDVLERCAAVALALGAAMLVSDAIVPLRLDAPVGFRDGERVLAVAAGLLVVESAVWVLVFVVALWRPRSILSGFGLTFAAVFLAIAGGSVVRDCAVGTCANSAARIPAAVGGLFRQEGAAPRWAVSTPREAPGAAATPNVYHVVLDGFNGAYFDAAMQGAGLTAEDLPGFVLFPFTRSQYDSTEFSTAAFLTGSLYGGGSLGDWIHSYNTAGLFHAMRAQRAVPARIYGDDGFHEWQGDVVAVRRETAMDGLRRASRSLERLALVRAAPGLLHATLFDAWRFEIGSPRADERRVMPFEMLLADEVTNPPHGQYTYVHILVPHAPYTLDRHCRVSESATYQTQTACAMTLVARLVGRLRELDRYESSLVLVHADHGWFDERWPDVRVVDPVSGQAVVRPLETRPAAAWDDDPLRLEAYSNALFLAKPPGTDSRPLVRDLRLVELVDVPNTIFRAVGLPTDDGDGVPVFGSAAEPDRVARVQMGVRAFDARGERMLFAGRDYREGTLVEHHWSPARGWFGSLPVPFVWTETEAQRCTRLASTAAAPLARLTSDRSRPDVLQLAWTRPAGASSAEAVEVFLSTRGVTAPLELIGRVPAAAGAYRVGDISATSEYRVGVRVCAGTCCSPAREITSSVPQAKP